MTLRSIHVSPEAHEDSVVSLVGRLVDDAKELAVAEVDVQKAKLSERITAYKAAAFFFAAAGVLALAALIALLVGLIMTLATLVGPGWATLIVIGVVFAVAGVLGYIGTTKLAAPTAPAREMGK